MSDTTPPSAAVPGAAATGKRGLVRNTGFSLLQQIVAMALAVLLVPFLLWRLGTEKYGLWLTLQIFSILGLIFLAELGFQGAIVRYLVRFHAEGDAPAFRRLLVTAFVLFTAIGAVCSTAVFVFANAAFVDVFAIPLEYAHEMRLALSVYALSLLIGFPGLVLKAFFAGIQDVATVKIWEMLDRVVFTLAVAGLLFFSDRLLHMVLVEQATMLGLFAIFAVLARRRSRDWFSINPRYANFESLRGVTGLSGMVFATSISNQVYIKAPEAIVGASLGPVALAHYQIATRIPRVLKSLQGALNASVLPYVAGLDDQSASSLQAKRRFALLGLRWNYVLFVPIGVFVAMFAPDILRLWVGREFAFLGTFVALYVLWQLSSVVVGFGNATLTRTEHFRRLVWQNLLVNALFLASMIAFLDRFGLTAVFVALLVSGMASSAVVLAASRKANGFTYREFARHVVLGPILGSAFAGAALLGGAKAILLSAGIVAGLAATIAAGVAYLLVIYFSVVDKTERGRLSLALAKLKRGN